MLDGLCGVRREEMVYDQTNAKQKEAPQKPSLRWDSIDLDEASIGISAAIAKKSKARYIMIPENALLFIREIPEEVRQGQVIVNRYSDDFDGRVRKFKNRVGVTVPRNALRNSFASYGVHFLGIEKTLEQMGHIDGGTTLLRHYRERTKATEAKHWFSLSPKTEREQHAIMIDSAIASLDSSNNH